MNLFLRREGRQTTQFADQPPSWASSYLENCFWWSAGKFTHLVHTGKKVAIRRKSDRQKTRHQRAGECNMLKSAKWAQWAGTLETPLAHTAQSSKGKFLPLFWSYEEREAYRAQSLWDVYSHALEEGGHSPGSHRYSAGEEIYLVAQCRGPSPALTLWMRCSRLTWPRVHCHMGALTKG